MTAMDVDMPLASSSTSALNGVRPRSPIQRANSEPINPPTYKVGYVYSSEMTTHAPQTDTDEDHPERPERIMRIHQILKHNLLLPKMKSIPCRMVDKKEVMLVHSEDHWDKVQAIQFMTDQQITDSSTYYEQLSVYVMRHTTRAARMSCAGVVDCCLAVARGELEKAFAIVRPPGHHAEPEEHLGFCFLNNVCVASRVVQDRTKLRKILILDWDVHHGNGTQKAFYDDDSVLYISLHRYDNGVFYPGGPFGGLHSVGENAGAGFSVNIPWPEAGMGDAEYLLAFQKVILPIAMEFDPDLVIISAGFDAAKGDHLGECLVTPAGYAQMTHLLSGLAGGKLVVALEGGYNLDAISESALAVTRVILGEAPPALGSLQANEVATETIWLVAKEQSRYWKNLDPKSIEPREDVPANLTANVSELMKAHRHYYLFKNYDMMDVPFVNSELDAKFGSQVMCTPDIFDNSVLVVFVHEFGNLRLEMESPLNNNIDAEKSYMLDFSKSLIEWIRKEKYALLDVNLYPKPVPPSNYNVRAKSKPSSKKATAAENVAIYLWDNYVQLSNHRRVILMGQGIGCQPLLQLVERRLNSLMKVTKAVVQIVGTSSVPVVPKHSQELAEWYRKNSLVILAKGHYVLGPPTPKAKEMRRMGTVLQSDESKNIKILQKALSPIQDFVQMQLTKSGFIPPTINPVVDMEGIES